MTVPIVPGPFSSLQSGGQALGALGEAKKATREEAAKGIQTLTNLVQLGILPSTIVASPEVQHLFRVAGLPAQAATAPNPREALAGRATKEIAGLTPGGVRIAAGLPTAEAEQKARVGAEALAPVSGTTPQGRAVAGVPGATPAAATEAAQAATAGAQVAAAGLEQQKATLQSNILAGAGAMLTDVGPDGKPKNPEALQLAQEASLGLLPYRIAQLQANRENLTIERQAMSDNARLLLGALNQITDLYQQKDKDWLASARSAAQTSGIDLEDEQAVGQFLDSFNRITPRPTFNAVRDEYLQTNLGMSAEEYQQRLRGTLDTIFGRGNVRERVRISRPAAQPSARPGGQRNKVDLAVQLLSDRVKRAGGFDQETANLLRDAAQQGKYTAMEIRSILARAGLLDDHLAKQLLLDLGEQP